MRKLREIVVLPVRVGSANSRLRQRLMCGIEVHPEKYSLAYQSSEKIILTLVLLIRPGQHHRGSEEFYTITLGALVEYSSPFPDSSAQGYRDLLREGNVPGLQDCQSILAASVSNSIEQ